MKETMEKTDKVKQMFGLVPGKDFQDESELDKYVCALDSYLDSLLIDTAGDEYSEDALEELNFIEVAAFPSAQAAYASREGLVLPEDVAREELLNDDHVSYVCDEEDIFVVFYNT